MQRDDARASCATGGTGKRGQQGSRLSASPARPAPASRPSRTARTSTTTGERVYYASFVGFFPAEDPQVTVLVSIDEPPAGDINRFGGTAAAPVFAELAPTIMHELRHPPPPDRRGCPRVTT